MKIPNKVVPLAYSIAKKIYEKKLDRSEGINQLVASEMNPNSAADYINNFKYMVKGKRFTRALNVFSIKYFLDTILKDYGYETLLLALSAVKEHIDYFENERAAKTTLRKLRKLYESYVINLSSENQNEREQNEIINQLMKMGFSKQNLLEELKKIKETDPEIISINGSIYKRDNKTIAQIKLLRDFKCEICSKSIIKRDGSKYIEAAHIKAKHLKGCETLYNIILLCPNHHKEFDLGNTVINAHTEAFVEFTINGTNFIIEFEILLVR